LLAQQRGGYDTRVHNTSHNTPQQLPQAGAAFSVQPLGGRAAYALLHFTELLVRTGLACMRACVHCPSSLARALRLLLLLNSGCDML
jgi:hypothetical protein